MAKPAIDFERVMKSPLGEVSAAQFIEAISIAKLDPGHIRIIADKKKYELWIEESPMDKVPVGVLIDKLRGEKKKVELEPLFDLPKLINPYIYERLVEDVANRLQGQLEKGG